MDTNNLRDILQKLNYNELIESFMEYAEVDNDFANAFRQFVLQKMRTGGEADARSAVDSSFSGVSILGRRNRYYESKDWRSIMKDRSTLFQDAQHALDFGNLRRAVAYPLQWLKRFSEEFTEEAFDFDDDGWEFKWACDEAMKIIEKVMDNAETDSQLKGEVCQELLALSNTSSVFEEYNFADIKTFARRMQALTESPEEALATIEGLLENDKQAENINSLILQKFNLLIAMGRGIDAFDFLEDNISKEDICSYLVDTLIELKYYDRALCVLEKALKLEDCFISTRWLEKEIEIYQILGDKQRVIATYRRLFIQGGGSLKIYKTLKSMIPVGEWKGYLSELISETRFDDYSWGEDGNIKAEIFLAEKDIDSLFQYMMQIKDDLLEFYSHYAAKLSPEQQMELIPKYVEEIRKKAAIAKKRDHYIRVCQYISHLKEMHGASEVVEKLIAEFLETYRRRPAFTAELKKLI